MQPPHTWAVVSPQICPAAQSASVAQPEPPSPESDAEESTLESEVEESGLEPSLPPSVGVPLSKLPEPDPERELEPDLEPE